MACDISAPRAKQCDTSQGGVEEYYHFNWIEDAFTVTAGIATAMNVALVNAYKYVVEGDGNTFESTGIADKKNGTRVYTQTVVAQLKQIDGATSVELDTLMAGKVSSVRKDRNGKYWWIADESYNVTSTVQEVTGGARVDFNGYNVTLVAESKRPAIELDSATVAAFLLIV